MRRVFRRRSPGLWALACALVLAATISPFALAAGEGHPIDGGARNPSSNPSLSYHRETQIIADNGTYGTRQSNKGTGGGAIYGCRAPAGAEPCIRAANLNNGQAFQFDTSGGVGGKITVGNGGDDDRPFTTNATGVATGLNADRVDGLNAADIVNQAVAKGAGAGAKFTCPTGTTPFGGACIETAPRGAQNFQGASNTCAAAGRQLVSTSQLISFRGAKGIALKGAEMTSDVVSQAGNAAYVTVDEQGAVASQSLGTGSAFRCVAPAVAPSAG